MKTWLAEVIAIGDELVSGQRLDTNSQWISQQLGQLGIRTAFHSTVGDDIDQNQAVFDTAIRRADIVISSGGLGPTADDLTREVIAAAAGVPLERRPEIVAHLEQLYARRNRQMPATNLCQADIPHGATIIPNPEGTAPGIDMAIEVDNSGRPNDQDVHRCRIFALPGVPAELKQMWGDTVQPAVRQLTGAPAVLRFRTLHVFGEGESKIEMMLPDLVRRGNDPTTGITASAATITLRVSTSGATEAECDAKIEPVLKTIHECLGDLVFGADGQTLGDVVVDRLVATQQTVAIVDHGLHGEVAAAIAAADPQRTVLQFANLPEPPSAKPSLQTEAALLLEQTTAQVAIAIGPINRDLAMIDAGESEFEVAIVSAGSKANPHADGQYVFRGHSSWRQQRAVKQVLDQLRKYLCETPTAN